MANRKGSLAGGAGADHGDLGRAISHEQCQAFVASVHRTVPGTTNVHQYHHHQCPGGPPGAMPVHVPVPRPLYSQFAMPPPPFARPPEHLAQSQPPTGRYQDYSPYGNTVSSQYTRGFADWGTHKNALVSLARATTTNGSGSNNINSNGFHQNISTYNTHTWTTTLMPRNPYNTAYGPPMMNMMFQTPSFHNHSHEKDSGAGFAASSIMMAPTAAPTSPFELMSPKSTNNTSTQIFEETNNLEDTSMVFGSGNIESDNSEEPDPTAVAEIEDRNQGNGHIINVMSKTVEVNCQDYRIILRKDLTNSDVGNIGRIVLPKKDAEPNLPILEDKDGLILEMDDFELPAVWKFKYRYWPNNKSRMYILETTGEFVKRHGLQAKDILVIYKNKKSGRYVVRAVKAEDIQVPECECIKAGNLSEECGFAVSPSAKKII